MFPSTFSTFNRPTATDRLDSPSHSALHNTVSSALGQVEAIIGLDGASSIVGTIISDLRNPDSDGGGHVQTANKGGTGQTSYTKGDILIATSSSVLTKLAVGADSQVLVANSSVAGGLGWAAVPAIIVSSTVAASSVWTKPAAATATSRVFVELWGGGGSGGQATASNEAGGGGGGGYASGWFSASILSSVLINVGRGGYSQTGNNRGEAGGITVFDPVNSLLTAYGGGGGDSSGTGAYGGGGAGTFENGLSPTAGAVGTGGATGGGAFNNNFTNLQIITLGGQTSLLSRLAPQGGAGGLGPNSGVIPASMLGQSAIYGGAGGGGATSSIAGASTIGGISTFAGNGGGGRLQTSGSAIGGDTPAGGGGASHGAGSSSGPGGSGMVKITVFL